ncbi:MAG TPA: EAL domain-containing protein [Gammaproteobacteria bacterium]|nr:EAL domain-containing protein [Gammaproteobacteria bacterium]
MDTRTRVARQHRRDGARPWWRAAGHPVLVALFLVVLATAAFSGRADPISLLLATALTASAVWVGHRVRRMHHLLDQFSGRLGIQLPAVGRGDPLRRLRKRLERLGEEVIAETCVLEYQARHDRLTNLPNRALLLDRLEAELLATREEGESLALLIMDLDHFKEVNDTLGHHVGDRLLQEVGRRLGSVLDAGEMAARLGGDEFAVLMPGAGSERAAALCRRILAVLERPVRIDSVQLRAPMSIGVALCPEHAGDSKLLMKYADVAMYQAKHRHQGFAFYCADTDEHSISRLGLAGALQEAIHQGQLMLEFQPMVDVKSGRIACAEALVRWQHPEYGIVGPEEFIHLAEQTGVIRPLTLWVVDAVLRQAAHWQCVGIDIRISVNLSVRSLQDRSLPAQVQKLLERHRVDPARIILEITESAIMSDPVSARRVMRRLAGMGFQLSIDDFGTGYSSLAYLKQLPVDEIKIDRSFVTRMDRDDNDAVIVRATIDLAHNLGLTVVAEGVENSEVNELLEMLGCDTVQGYYICRPMQAGKLASWLQTRAAAGSVLAHAN